jgi:hypothetical protein
MNLTAGNGRQNGSSATAGQAIDNRRIYDFTNSQFVMKDKMDVRAFKLELDALDLDDDRAHGSVF